MTVDEGRARLAAAQGPGARNYEKVVRELYDARPADQSTAELVELLRQIIASKEKAIGLLQETCDIKEQTIQTLRAMVDQFRVKAPAATAAVPEPQGVSE